jgi:hypothetical protein
VDNADAPQNVLVFASASHDPDGTIIERDWDWDGDGVYDSFDSGSNDSHLYPGLGTAITLRVVDDQLATATLTLPVHYNEQPVAQLTSPTPVADPLAVVTLDASGSSDPDGTIAHFAWDLDDNGVFGEAGAEAAASDQPTTTVTLNADPGLQSVNVEVTDDGGRTATARLTLTARGWRLTTVDATTGTIFPSLAVVNGLPAIVYQNNPVGTLDYATNAQSDGLGAWTITRSIFTGDPYQPQLVEAAGFPALAVADGATQRVWFSHSDQADGSANWHSLQIDPTITVDGMADLTLTATGLGISYYDATAMQLRYAYTAVQDGGGGWNSLAIDSTGDDTGYYSSISVIDGNPAIAYVDSTTGGIRYAWSTEPDGSTNWDDINVLNSGTNVDFGDLAEISGAPAFSAADPPNGIYGYSTQSDGSSGWSTLDPDPAFNTGPGSRLFAYQGHPCVVYTALALSGGIEFGRSSTPDGRSGWTAEQVDAQGTTPSALLVDGRPAIAYAGSFPVSGIFYAVLFE